MFDAFRAEVLKLRRHRGTWFLVWIYPLVAALLTIAQLIWDATGGVAAAQPGATWLEQSQIFLAAPATGVGRFLVAAFAALVFAGEYGWNTWKLIIPARPRWQLVAAKWAAATSLVLGAFLLADAIALAGSAARAALGGPAIPAGVTAIAILDAHGAAAARAVVPIVYSVVWAGLFAVLTRSVMAAVVMAMGLLFFEQLLQPIALLAHPYLPQVTAVVLQALPPYHVANLLGHANGPGLILLLGADARIAASAATSLLVTLGWIAVAGALTALSFGRQDLN